MGSLSGFRPPQFSEDDAWLPPWLQQCNGERMDLEGMKEDNVTFDKRVEELLCLQKGVSNGESLREEGGCNIGQLFLSGTDSSPFSCALSADNVVQFHLCLSSDGNSENTTPIADAYKADPNYPIFIQPLETLGIWGQKDVNLSTFLNAGATNFSQTVDLERHVNKNELLKHDGNANFSGAASDAVELCIAASEALAINEVIKSDSLGKPLSASAILEASLQMKQARLEAWENSFGGSIPIMSDTDNLSDLDDIAMESTYEDAGIHFTELSGTELSVSRVKDTLESEDVEELEHKKTGASARICDKPRDYNYAHRMEGVINNNIQLRKDLAAEYCGNDTQKNVTCNPECDPGTDVGFQNDCLRTLDVQAKLHPSLSAEKVNTLTAENNPHETNVSSSPIMNCQDGEKEYSLPNIVQERFQSRWFGGWTSNNELKYTTVKRSIPQPFVGETTSLSESADTAPDENSFVQNHDKQAIISSQLSIPSGNFSNRAKDAMLLSQDVGSSTASLVDPLCSVVPCSISENMCSSPATNHEAPVLPRHFDITIECEKDNVRRTSPLDNLSAEGERTARQTTDINDSQNEVSRQFTPLRNYSTLLPSYTRCCKKDSNQKRSFFIERNAALTFQETNFSNMEETVKTGAEVPVANNENGPPVSLLANRKMQCHFRVSICSMHNFAEGNLTGTTQLEASVKCLPSENLPWTLSQCKNKSAQKLASKRVHFSERETNIPDNKKFQKVQTASKPCCSTRAAKRPTRSSTHLESKAKQLDRYLRTNLDKEKKRLIFQNMEFLLTGFSQHKEKEIEGLIRKYGGIVFSQIPSTNLKGNRSFRLKSRVLPVVLCLKKMQSFKFLYGCAVNAYVLRLNWLTDSIAAGFVLPPNRYMILSKNISRISRRHNQVYTALKYNNQSLVFNNLGILLHGKSKYFTNITTIVQHGGGQVFKTLQRLIQTLETGKISMAVVVGDGVSGASRHLKHCALEQNIPMTSVYWIIKCLYAGELIPLEEKKNFRTFRRLPAIKLQRHQDSLELSQEI